MNRKKITLGGAAAGVAAGVVGLVALANPASAGVAPSLPQVSPDQLVQSVLTAKHPAMAGTVDIHNGLGLPAIPGLPAQASAASSQVRVWTDGADKARVSLPDQNSEETIVDDGTTVWDWNSSKRTVTKSTHPAEKPGAQQPGATKQPNKAAQEDPATLAKNMIAQLQKTSTVSVDGTSTVADRPAYDLVLTPKPNEKTLLREVRVSIDSQTRMPVQVSVLANGSPDPALQVGFSKLNIGTQDPSLFTFTPPAGVQVQDKSADEAKQGQRPKTEQKSTQVIGDGWDAVTAGRMPTTAPATTGSHAGKSQDPMAIVKRVGTPVSGAWGHGWVVTTKVGTALLTDDGRFAAGAVPEQVLFDSIGSVK